MIYIRRRHGDVGDVGRAPPRFGGGRGDDPVGLVVDTIRDFGPSEAEATLRLVGSADAPIVGLGLTGVEGAVPAEDFVELRQESRRLGLGFTVHAGEMGPPASIAESLDVLEADRIAPRRRRDPELLERLGREQVPLDVCPSSNVGTGLFSSLEAHPVVAFWRAGVTMTISSDDPPFFGTSLTDELRTAVRLAGLSRSDLVELQLRAARVSFATPARRAELEAAIRPWAAAEV
jgi:adenosine deaminase